MCRLNRKRKRATEQFVARPCSVLVQPDANPSSQFSSRLQIGLGKGTASAVPIRPNRRWALAPEERASRTRWTPFKSVQNYWVFRSPLCTVILRQRSRSRATPNEGPLHFISDGHRSSPTDCHADRSFSHPKGMRSGAEGSAVLRTDTARALGGKTVST